MWQARSFCCLYKDCLRTSLFLLYLSLWTEVKSCRLHGLPLKHRCEEPLIWTVIPLSKPWAEPYSDTPDCHKQLHLCYHVFLHSQISDGVGCAALSPWLLKRKLPGDVSSGREGRASLPDNRRLVSHCKRIITWNSTQLDSLRVLPVSVLFLEGERGRRWLRKRRGFFSLAQIYWKRLPLNRMSLTATQNLKDCSTDALYLCTNYAKWPNQLLFPSSAWCACLWMHCPIPLPFLLRGTTPALLFFFLYGNKIVEWIWTFHSLFGLSTLILYSGTKIVFV